MKLYNANKIFLNYHYNSIADKNKSKYFIINIVRNDIIIKIILSWLLNSIIYRRNKMK